MKNYKLIILLFSVFVLCACKSTNADDPAAQYHNYTSDQLFNAGEVAIAKHHYSQAIKYLTALDSLYPFGSNNEAAQRDIIYAYFKTRDYASSEAASDRFIRLYPRSQYIDYAYYMKGLSELFQNRTVLQRVFPVDVSLRNLDTARQAFFNFRDLIQFYPDSKYAPDARQQMVYLRDLFARQELLIANFYYERYAYVGAANRATYIIDHYQGTPQVEQALVILVKANRKLGLMDAANNALQVLRTNYPNSKYLRKLG